MTNKAGFASNTGIEHIVDILSAIFPTVGLQDPSVGATFICEISSRCLLISSITCGAAAVLLLLWMMISTAHPAATASGTFDAQIQDAARSGRLAELDRLLDETSAGEAIKRATTALACAATDGHIDVVDAVLRRCLDSAALYLDHHCLVAVRAGHVAVVDRLLRDRVCLASLNATDALVEAACHGHAAVTERLLAYPRLRQVGDCQQAIAGAARYGHAAVVELLLHPSSMHPAAGDVREQARLRRSAALRAAAESGHVAIVRRLIRGVTVPAASLMEAAGGAACVAASATLAAASEAPAAAGAGAGVAAVATATERARVSSPPVQAASGIATSVLCEPLQASDGEMLCELIFSAAQWNRVAVVETLLAQATLLGGDKGTADGCSAALCGFAGAGNVARVRELLRHPLVDPAVDDNRCIVDAARSGVLPVVEMLLADPRVDPGGGNGMALEGAVEDGCTPVVDLLLQHPGVHLYDQVYDCDGHGDVLGLSQMLDMEEGASRSREFVRLHVTVPTSHHGQHGDDADDADRHLAGGGGASGTHGRSSASSGGDSQQLDSCDLLSQFRDSPYAGSASSSHSQRPSEAEADHDGTGRSSSSHPFVDSDSEDPGHPERDDSESQHRRERQPERRRAAAAARAFAAAVPPGCVDVTMRLLLQPSLLRSRLPCYRGVEREHAAAHAAEFRATWLPQLRRWPGSRIADLGWLAWRRRMPLLAARVAAFAAADAEAVAVPADVAAADIAADDGVDAADPLGAGIRPPSTPPYFA